MHVESKSSSAPFGLPSLGEEQPPRLGGEVGEPRGRHPESRPTRFSIGFSNARLRW
jgi:hypothetical protein